MNEGDRAAISSLREHARDLLTKKYNTDFNLLRWAQGYNYDMNEASEELRRHLKFRKFYNLDDAENIAEHEILKKYFPIGLVGETGIDNKLLVIECAGRIDLMGILKSVHLSDFLIQRYRFQERMLDSMNEVEARSGKQASVIYVLDLEGLKFDPTLLSVVTGPYRILWASVYTNYPEWIDKMFIINAPSFISLLWKAIAPLLPERTRSKVSICGSKPESWEPQLLQHVLADKLPKHWGGKLVDHNGDGMCRDRLNIPFDQIPHDLYWKPCKETPDKCDLTCTVIPPGKARIFTFFVSEDAPFYMIVNRYCERTFGMGVYYSPNVDDVDSNVEDMTDWFPDFDYPAMPTTDYLRVLTPGAGVYKVKFGNEGAWIRSLTVWHRIRFQNQDKIDIDFKCFNE